MKKSNILDKTFIQTEENEMYRCRKKDISKIQ
jgi:hypothetical protein